MKFGKVFRTTIDTRMPHWRDHMIDYKALKQAIKRQLAQGTQGACDPVCTWGDPCLHGDSMARAPAAARATADD